MRCPQCGGKMVRGLSDRRVIREGYDLTLHRIPAWLCERCGQPLFDDEQSRTLEALIAELDAAVQRLRMEWRG